MANQTSKKVIFRRSYGLAWVSLVLLLVFAVRKLKNRVGGCKRRHWQPDGGDCQAIGGPRRPNWACYSDMMAALPKFLKVYKRRPFKNNKYGMKLDHSFALYYILRQIQPTTVIESGALNGHGTWVIRNALPEARIISIDPKRPKIRMDGVHYLNGDGFMDYADIDWDELEVDPKNTLVFLDDHHDNLKRMFTHNYRGFQHFIIEDNYPFPFGDSHSLKWVCETRRKHLWPGFVQDNFGKVKEKKSWSQHLEDGRLFNKAASIYYEFPSIVSHKMVPNARSDPYYRSPPIIDDWKDFNELIRHVSPNELKHSMHLAYVHLRKEFMSPAKTQKKKK